MPPEATTTESTTTTSDTSTNANPSDKPGETGTSRVVFTTEQQAEVDRIAAAARRDGKATGKTETEAALTARQEQEAADRKRDEEVKRGDFERVRTDLESERNQAKEAVTSLTAENDRLRAAMATGVEARWNDLPELVAKSYRGEADDPLAKWEFLHDENTQALAAKVRDTDNRPRGNGPSPRPSGRSGPTSEELLQEARRSGQYTF